MIKVKGQEFDFCFTRPSDIAAYMKAVATAEAETLEWQSQIPKEDPADDMKAMELWCFTLNADLQVLGNFIDNVLGDGVAEKLLGLRPSLIEAQEILNELHTAIDEQGGEAAKRLSKFQPVTTKAKKKK